jgi:hypothetical protein
LEAQLALLLQVLALPQMPHLLPLTLLNLRRKGFLRRRLHKTWLPLVLRSQPHRQPLKPL